VLVALSDIELESSATRRTMTRSDVALLSVAESYEPPLTGAYFEVAIKPPLPPVQRPSEVIPAEKNLTRL
jgi:hypothetical protein